MQLWTGSFYERNVGATLIEVPGPDSPSTTSSWPQNFAKKREENPEPTGPSPATATSTKPQGFRLSLPNGAQTLQNGELVHLLSIYLPMLGSVGCCAES